MSSWVKYYSDRVNTDYQEYFEEKYKPFLHHLMSVIPEYYFGLGEFGCGIGSTTKFLVDKSSHSHYLYDNDAGMLTLARQNIDISGSKVLYHIHDITKKMPPRHYDLIHSHGVLEHFNDINIQNIVYHQLEMCYRVVHYVPTIEYKEPSFGDERLMAVEDWLEILSDFHVEPRLFNQDKDLILDIRKDENKKSNPMASL